MAHPDRSDLALRDGAAWPCSEDAIAGVVNVVVQDTLDQLSDARASLLAACDLSPGVDLDRAMIDDRSARRVRSAREISSAATA